MNYFLFYLHVANAIGLERRNPPCPLHLKTDPHPVPPPMGAIPPPRPNPITRQLLSPQPKPAQQRPQPRPQPRPQQRPPVQRPQQPIRQALQIPKPIARQTMSGFEGECLQWHNQYRQQEGRPPLVWSNSLQAVAQSWSNTLAAGDDFKHSGFHHGENLFQTTNGDMSCKAAVKAWYDEKPLYRGQKIGQGDFHSYGHYTQLEWKTTKSVGCAKTQYSAGGNTKQTIVCEYDPPGNIIGMVL